MNLRGPRGGQACLGALAVCSMLSIPMLHAAPAATALTRFEQGSTAFQEGAGKPRYRPSRPAWNWKAARIRGS